MAGDLRVVGGLDLEAREARREARRRAGPIHRMWRNAIHAHIRDRQEPRLLRGDDGLAEELTNYPSANYGYAYVGQQRAADRLGASLRTVQRMFARYVAAGFLVRQFGGQGRTSKWTFAIGGVPCFESKNFTSLAGLDPPYVAGLDTTRMAGLDPPQVAYKPVELQPVELQPVELQPPSPPAHTPGPRAKAAGEIAAAIAAQLPADIRRHRLWRSLPSWIDALTDNGFLDTDIVGGVLLSLPSLNDATPSSLKYFEPAIRRARDTRVSPLPAATVSKRAIERELCQQCGVPAGTIVQRLGAERLAALHHRYVEGALASALAKEIYDELRS